MKMDNMNIRHQQGTALLIGLLLLVVVTIMTTFAVNVGVFEQRASGNELRHKQAFHAAEGGLAAAIEYVKLNQVDMLGESAGNWFDSNLWSQCAGTETAPHPCAYMSEDLEALGAGGFIYYYDDADDRLDIPAVMNPAGLTTYQVAALVCIFDTDDDECLNEVNREDTDDFAMQLISFGASDDAVGQGSVSAIIAPFPVIRADVAAPVVANSFTATGTFDLVTNPNGGGDGVPVSVWSPNTFTESGNAITCNQEEFFRTEATAGAGPTEYDGTIICENCACPDVTSGTDDMEFLPLTDGAFVDSGDIVDDDPNFPDDLFKFVFGKPTELYETVKSRAENVETDCDGLTTTTGGFYWIEGDCALGSDIGTPSNPIFLVAACGDLSVAANRTIYGLIYIQNLEGCASPRVQVAGGTQIYGAVISDPEIEFGAGSSQIIFNEDVLNNIDTEDRVWGLIPGTWKDIVDDSI